ncbi:hypothetical protein B0H14DRAFT_2596542 [Mycena olivaceomarginata]|nr:hypothetical protein B0H14DRAFT_2596542 [Mycena olivaceomarginata]
MEVKMNIMALLELEQLVVKRLFELTKMNMSGTGHKLQKHIAKALQTRSKTLQTALHCYNEAAMVFSPPHRQLTWQEVIDFTFLSDIDLLRNPEGNARAQEEIEWLNIEICQFVTYIKDEKVFLLAKEAQIRETDPELAFFVRRYCLQPERFDTIHMKLRAFVDEAGPRFTGTLEPGVRRATEVQPEPMNVDVSEEERELVNAVEAELQRGRVLESEDDEEWETDDSDDEFEGELLAEEMEAVMVLAVDKENDNED